MFKKIATFSHNCSVKALNKPKGKGWEIYNFPNQIKTASINIEGEDLGGFDLKEATKEHPDFLYIKIFAIKEDEVNDNGDSFSPAELKKAADTFVGVPLFTNHQNDDVEKSKGECVHSWYDSEAGGIYIIGRVDKIAYPKLARGVEAGYVNGTSMGCSVSMSCCSVCHNASAKSDYYCSHIKERKNRKFSGDIKCRYHDSKDIDKEDKCPLCGSTKDDIKTVKHSEQQIYEHNYGLKFIENSFVVNPACHDCGVTCILNVPEVQKKVASFSKSVNNLIKYADEDEILMNKFGGAKELNSLKNSMNEMEVVVKSMLKQKENISMEYVSDLVKAMADVQGIFDELVEMGYAALPSPTIAASDLEEGLGEQQLIPEQPQQTPQPEPQPQANSTPGSSVQDMAGLGSITLPKNSSKKIKDFSKISKNIEDKVESLYKEINNLKEKFNNRIGVKMAKENKTQKTAAGTENLEIITEKQLEKKEEKLHPRTDTIVEGITESKEQIGGSEQSNDTTTESPQVRKGSYETITEDQLETIDGSLVRFETVPEVITEKQWDDMSRSFASDVSEDYTTAITESQIRDLLSKHKFIGDVETITEDQLKNISMTDGLKRWASQDYSVSLMKVAINTISDIVYKYQKSPEEILKVASILNDDHDAKMKVSYLSVLNSLPQKKEERDNLEKNNSYFNKTASRSTISTMDALILAASENGQFNMKAEDLMDSIYHALKDKITRAKIEEVVKEKRSSIENKNIVTKADAFSNAVKVLDRPEDGKYQIKATLEDIGVAPTDKVAFLKGVKKFAQEMIDDEGVAAAVIKLEVGDNGELIIDIQDGGTEEVCPDDIGDILEGPVEDIDAGNNGDEEGIVEVDEEETKSMEGPSATPMSYAENKENKKIADAKKEIKEAQMMGGEMGGQGGASQAPGAGATLPGVPGQEVPPIDNLTEEPGLDDTSDLDSDGDLDPLPPGSICAVCGSNDVDVISGKGKCNNCGSEMTFKVDVNVTKWTGITPTGDDEGMEDVGELGEGEGFEMPAGDEMGGPAGGMGGPAEGMGEMPAMAAYTKLAPEALKKIASQNIKLGTVSPATGSTNTIELKDGTHICLDTGTKYTVSYIFDSKDPKKGAYAQWEWTPKVAGINCPSCTRGKIKFVKALSTIGMTEDKFDNMELKDKVETIVKLNKSGSLTKTASKEGSVIEDYKIAYGTYGNSFPVESCIEKLSRRFGKDALCLSGPDEGSNLAESVCNRLKKADTYTDGLARKVASIWNDCDGDEDCITDQVRSGYTLRESAVICDTLKTAVAQPEYIFADALGIDEVINEGPVDDNGGQFGEPAGEEDIDPFESIENDEINGEGGETVTIELPADVARQLEEAVEQATGEGSIEESMEGSPIDGIEGSPIEEIGPDELDETKPIVDEMTEDTDNIGGAVQPCTEFEGEITEDGAPENSKKVVVNVDESLTGDDDNDGFNGFGRESKTEGLDYKEALNMSGSALGKVGKPQMDLSSVIDAINKVAGEKEISQEKAQDSSDIGSYTAGENGSQMGHENETIPSAGKPSVPRDNATMGQEPTDLNPQDKPQPVIPSDDATMGHEKEVGLSGGDNTYTGGDKGQGKTELSSVDADLFHMKGFGSSKDSLSRIADRIAKKLAPPEAVSKDKDIQPISGKSTIGKEEKFDAEEVNKSEVKSDSGFMGHENETLKSKPDSPKDHPDVNTGNAQMGKEELDSEKTTKDKGTVIASNGSSESEAHRLAGRMLQANKIEASDLQSKINELKGYKPAQIKDIERGIFAGQKGLDTVSGGMSQAVQISEASSVRDSQDELSGKLRGLFTLGKQNKWADEDPTTQLRQDYK